MTKNPIVNALAALAYVVLVVSLIFNGEKLLGPEETIMIPIAMLSLFVLSAAVMVYIFFTQPFRFYFDGQKETGVKLFLQTVGAFAIFTILAFVVVAYLG